MAGIAAGQNGVTVVAEINGRKIMRAELEQNQAARLLDMRYKYYLAERQALDQLIDDQLIEMQASREHLSVEQLLEREVNSQLKDPTEDQLQVYYEGLQTEEPFAAVRDKILDTVRQIRRTKVRTAYLKSLRSNAIVRIALTTPSADVTVGDAPTRGRRDAPVLMVEFADYECGYCQRIHPELRKLQDEFGGKLALAFKDFPLPMHQHAQKAAEAAHCAGMQGKFWDYQSILFENSQKFDMAQLKEHARTLKLDATAFDRCLDSGERAATVKKNLDEAQRLGLTGTPSFFINGHFISGAASYSTLREMIEQQLAEPLQTEASDTLPAAVSSASAISSR
jgi:protein-disulfide isomerase